MKTDQIFGYTVEQLQHVHVNLTLEKARKSSAVCYPVSQHWGKEFAYSAIPLDAPTLQRFGEHSDGSYGGIPWWLEDAMRNSRPCPLDIDLKRFQVEFGSAIVAARRVKLGGASWEFVGGFIDWERLALWFKGFFLWKHGIILERCEHCGGSGFISTCCPTCEGTGRKLRP